MIGLTIAKEQRVIINKMNSVYVQRLLSIATRTIIVDNGWRDTVVLYRFCRAADLYSTGRR